MTLQNAMAQANNLRPNMLPEDILAHFVHEIDCQAAELMELETPAQTWPEDAELLLPAPHDDVYVFYLMAMIDNLNEDAALYQNDMEIFNSKMAETRAWWRRHNKPEQRKNWRVGL